MSFRLLDLGGSGVKTAKLPDLRRINELKNTDVFHYSDPNWEDFPEWASNEGLLDASFVGISCAGFVVPDEKIKLFRVADWHDRELVKEIYRYIPSSKVFLLNDAESHLMAHANIHKPPLMSISLGTSLGFSVSNIDGGIMRSLDGINYDLGEMTLPTRASNNRVWWALGSHGLSELQDNLGKDEGVIHFGYRLGAFLSNVCSVFRPSTVVFSGGITANHWHLFWESMMREFNHQKPDWLNDIKFVKSQYANNAALIGIGKYVQASINR